jgi:uncharacterized protein YhbP (UPF0306 family)
MDKIKELIKEVLERGYLMSLATVDDGGVWVADVIYVYDEELNIYWMSDPDVRHSRAILKNPKAAGTITVSSRGDDNMGLQFEGTVEKIEGPRYDLVLKHFDKRHKPTPDEREDVLQGDFWYVLRPSKIELIYEKEFGFEKQEIKL